MLILEDNKLNVTYTQKVYSNEFKSKRHTYVYYEFIIPNDIWNLWKLTRKKINYVSFLCGHIGDNNFTFVVPSGVEDPVVNNLKIYNIFDKEEFQVETVVSLKVRKRGTYYYLRLNNKFVIDSDTISFTVDPYRYNNFTRTYFSINVHGIHL